MKYTIHNKHLIQPESQQAIFEEEVQKKREQLGKIIKGYKKELNLDIFIKTDDKQQYNITASLPIRNNSLQIEVEGKQVISLMNELLDKLYKQLKDQLEFERREYVYKQKNHQEKTINENINKLSSYKNEGSKDAFIHLLTDHLHSLTKYIKRQFKMAKAIGLNKDNIISLNDLVSETYVRVFELFNTKPDIAENLLPWMYQVADDVLEEQLHEKAYEKVTNLEEIVNAEINTMKESFTADADGDLIMMEELDDPSYNSQYYNTGIVLKDEANEEIIEKVAEQFDEKQANEAICKILAAMPSINRSVFDLYWLEGLKAEEISFVKRITVQEAENLLTETKQVIVQKLLTQ